MPIRRGVAVEIARLAVQVCFVAGVSASIVVYTWDATRSSLRTLIVTTLLVSVVRVLHSRYRIRRTRERGRFYLPMHCPNGSTAI